MTVVCPNTFFAINKLFKVYLRMELMITLKIEEKVIN